MKSQYTRDSFLSFYDNSGNAIDEDLKYIAKAMIRGNLYQQTVRIKSEHAYHLSQFRKSRKINPKEGRGKVTLKISTEINTQNSGLSKDW